ncbi:hypothetical protein QA648_30985 (plasmid) [Rhizobium sp. CB3171]|nr:hypothetical protein [Rhizobium sp. CB3171]WFU05154.1 hypothetical protein QA648_30985 [Rhizobium sp. CB3171]
MDVIRGIANDISDVRHRRIWSDDRDHRIWLTMLSRKMERASNRSTGE